MSRTTAPVVELITSATARAPNHGPACCATCASAAKCTARRDNALDLVFKIIERLSGSWQPLDGDPHLLELLSAGAQLRDGILVEPATEEASAA